MGSWRTRDPGRNICDASTVDPGTSRRVHEAARAKGIRALDCPVSGGPPGAEAGTLTIMVGGEAVDLELCARCCRPSARRSSTAAARVGPGRQAGESVAGGRPHRRRHRGAVGGASVRLSLDTLVAILRSSSGASWMLENHVRFKALAGNHEPGFAWISCSRISVCSCRPPRRARCRPSLPVRSCSSTMRPGRRSWRAGPDRRGAGDGEARPRRAGTLTPEV